MCMFSGPVPHVSGTRIYAGPRDDGYQRIAYAMTVEVPSSLAMVLPIPTPPSPAEDAVRFVDMSSCPTFLDDLDELFEERERSFGGAVSRYAGPPPQTLVVHDVGDFEASFVPTLGDFARLDARFRLPDDVWPKLPHYAEWSFCVFKLKPRPSLPKKRHPMAFDFPRRKPNEIFFPTVHVHDGAVHAEAHFDHTLFVQLDEPLLPAGWDRPLMAPESLPPAAKAFVRVERPMFRKVITGTHPNRDIVVPTSS